MDHVAHVWGDAISAREHVSTDVADILKNARLKNIAYARLEEVPIFIREYVLDKALLADTCVAATIVRCLIPYSLSMSSLYLFSQLRMRLSL